MAWISRVLAGQIMPSRTAVLAGTMKMSYSMACLITTKRSVAKPLRPNKRKPLQKKPRKLQKKKEADAKKAAKQKEAEAKKAAKQNQNRRKTKNTTRKKKKLGGVQGPMVNATSTGAADAGRRFSKGESVNARYSNNKYYGAFICKVNDDGTYNLYFFEEWDKKPLLFNVAEKHIKKQLQCKGSKRYKSWDKYVGKTFFDPGTKDEPNEPDFEAGEFVVNAVLDGQLFECARVDEDNCIEQFDIGYVLGRIRNYEEE